MYELCVKIPGLVVNEHDLSNNNRLSDLRKHKVYCGSPSASSAHALLRLDRPAGTFH